MIQSRAPNKSLNGTYVLGNVYKYGYFYLFIFFMFTQYYIN